MMAGRLVLLYMKELASQSVPWALYETPQSPGGMADCTMKVAKVGPIEGFAKLSMNCLPSLGPFICAARMSVSVPTPPTH